MLAQQFLIDGAAAVDSVRLFKLSYAQLSNLKN